MGGAAEDRGGLVGEQAPERCDGGVRWVGLVGEPAGPAAGVGEPALDVAGEPAAVDADPDRVLAGLDAASVAGRALEAAGVAPAFAAIRAGCGGRAVRGFRAVRGSGPIRPLTAPRLRRTIRAAGPVPLPRRTTSAAQLG